MHSTIGHIFSPSLEQRRTQSSVWHRFITWTDGQEKNRFGWTAGIITGHGCVFTVITMMAILFTGNHFIFWPFAIASMAACLVVNLAAMPMRIILPVFFFSLLIDLVIIVLCLANGFDLGATYV